MNQVTTTAALKSMLSNETLRKRFNEVLGKKANQFISSMLSTVTMSKQLQECDPKSIISSALIAASLDLPIDQNLGFSAIVPYNCKGGKRAQFQMMAKGFIQLAIRTGQYEAMNYSEIYEDELIDYNPITKEAKFIGKIPDDGDRANSREEKIIGYYSWFRLLSGFKQDYYMTTSEVKAHAKKYSASYRKDLEKGWKSSRWSTDFDVMAKKTVIKLLLSKWGILSVEMQKALSEDQKVYEGDENGKYLDNESETIDITTDVSDPFEKASEELSNERSEEKVPEPGKEAIVENRPNKHGKNKANSASLSPSQVSEDENGRIIG